MNSDLLASSPEFNEPQSSEGIRSRLTQFGLAMAVYRAVSILALMLKPLCLKSIGITDGELIKIQKVQLLLLVFLELPLSFYADKFSQKKASIFGLGAQWCSVIIYLALTQWASRSMLYLYALIYLAEILARLGRSIAGTTLEAWAIALFKNLSKTENFYAHYLYKAQKYSCFFGFLAHACVIPLAYLDYRIALVLLFALYSASIFTFFGIPAPKPQPTSEATVLPTKKPQEEKGTLLVYLSHIGSTAYRFFSTSWGYYCITIFSLMSILRYLTQEYWVLALFSKNLKVSRSLSREVAWPMLVTQLGIALSEYGFNEIFRKRKELTKLPVVRVMLFGSLAAVAVPWGMSYSSALWPILPLIWVIRGSLNFYTLTLKRLFGATIPSNSAAMGHSLMHLIGKLSEIIFLHQVLQPCTKLHGTPNIYYLVALGFSMVTPFLLAWKKLINNSPPKSG